MNTIWILRIISAIVVLQTLRYKFTGHPESKKIFTQVALLGLPEKYGRIGTGILELFLGVLVLIPETSPYAAVGIIFVMLGAITAHITKIGFKGENLALALSAVAALISSGLIVALKYLT